MTFRLFPYQVTGPSYQSRSKPLSSQRTVNFYPQFSDEGKDQFVLMPFPGLKRAGDYNSSEADRGLTRIKESLYQVKGESIYFITKVGAHTSVGNIPGSERCIFANDGINLIIVTGGKVYVYSTDTSQVKDLSSSFNGPVLSVDSINGQFLFTLSFTTVVMTLDNTTKTLSSLGEVGAITKPDDLVRDFVFEQTIWRFVTRTTEAWYNSGVGQPPIARLEGQIFDVGLSAINSVAQTDEAFYWLGDDYAVYRARAGTKERISTDAISNELEKLDVSGAIGYTFTFQGQNFYALKIPDNFTYVLSESLGQKGWFELSSGIQDEDYQASSVVDCYGLLWAADESNGRVYNLDIDTYTNNEETILRTRTCQTISGAYFNAKGKRVGLKRLELIMDTGNGLITGQGENPRVMIEWSYDGGRTFDTGTWARVGRLGENILKVECFMAKSFYNAIPRISISDPVSCAIFEGTIELRLAGL